MVLRRVPQQLRAKRTRRLLLEAARRVFAERGWANATVDDVALAAGCSKGAYYFHFTSKEEILLALVEEWVRTRTRRLQEALDGDRRPTASLITLLETLLSPETTGGREARLLMELWSQAERNPKVRRRLARAYRSWRDLLVRAFARAQEAGVSASAATPEEAAAAALALHDGLVAGACLRLSPGALAPGRTSAALALLVGHRALRAAG